MNGQEYLQELAALQSSNEEEHVNLTATFCFSVEEVNRERELEEKQEKVNMQKKKRTNTKNNQAATAKRPAAAAHAPSGRRQWHDPKHHNCVCRTPLWRAPMRRRRGSQH